MRLLMVRLELEQRFRIASLAAGSRLRPLQSKARVPSEMIHPPQPCDLFYQAHRRAGPVTQTEQQIIPNS